MSLKKILKEIINSCRRVAANKEIRKIISKICLEEDLQQFSD